MAHGITSVDKGFVHGTTWHGLEQYKQQDFPVTSEQAIEVLDYPLEKRRLYRQNTNGEIVEASAWEIIRSDYDMPLAHHVGKDFTVMSNKALFDYIEKNVLSEAKDINIESVGTLWGGKIAFVNLNVGEFSISNDDSKTVSRLMYYNPLGLGKYKVCAHNVRVVCNNTLRMATSESVANGLLRMVSHTKNAEMNIKGALSEILEIRKTFLEMKSVLERLSEIQASTDRVERFFDKWLPVDEKDGQAKSTRRINLVNGIMNQFESDDSIKGKSMYSLLNAVTYWYDHEIPSRGNDLASIAWDGIVGNRSEKKVSALNIMQDTYVDAI